MNRRFLGVVALSAPVLVVGSAHAESEHYEAFRFDTGLSGTYVSASGRGGFGAVFEPKFYVHDNVLVGARVEGAVMFGGKIDQGTGDTQMDLGAVGAAMLKGEYLVGTSGLRPFAGLGLGFYDIASQSIAAGPTTTGIDQKAGRYFGVSPQVGVDLGRLRLAATYNVILGADIEVSQMVGGAVQTASFSQNYLTFELGIRFGGRKKPAALIPPPPAYEPPMAPPPMPPPPMAPPPMPADEPPADEPPPSI